jgi:DNA repair protein RecO (recombination protein O)
MRPFSPTAQTRTRHLVASSFCYTMHGRYAFSQSLPQRRIKGVHPATPLATRMTRITQEPAYVLHRYDWSETSLIVEVFSRRYGRLALVAKGAKRPSSQFRPVLLPMQPLALAWGGDAEVRTLKSAEWTGGQIMPSGERLLMGYYLNELLLKGLAREDPHPVLFDAYGQILRLLVTLPAADAEPVLRAFELLLLRELGVLPALDFEASSQRPLAPSALYLLQAEGGLCQARADDPQALASHHWQALHQALHAASPSNDLVTLVQTTKACNTELKAQLRSLLHHHCGVARLKTRQLMVDIRGL